MFRTLAVLGGGLGGVEEARGIAAARRGEGRERHRDILAAVVQHVRGEPVPDIPGDSARADVQRPRPVAQEVGGQTPLAVGGLAGEEDGFVSGLERAAPPLPGRRLGRGGGEDVQVVARRGENTDGPSVRRPGQVPGTVHAGRAVAAHHLRAPRAEGRVDGLGQVQRLGQPVAVEPHQLVAYLETRVLRVRRRAVVGARRREAGHVPARLQDAQRLGGPALVPALEEAHRRLPAADLAPPRRVPPLVHEGDAVGRVGDHAVHGRVGKPRERGYVVAPVQDDPDAFPSGVGRNCFHGHSLAAGGDSGDPAPGGRSRPPRVWITRSTRPRTARDRRCGPGRWP